MNIQLPGVFPHKTRPRLGQTETHKIEMKYAEKEEKRKNEKDAELVTRSHELLQLGATLYLDMQIRGIIVLIDCWLTWGNQRQNAEECTSHRSLSANLPDFPDSPYYASCKTLFSSVLQNFSVQNFYHFLQKSLNFAID